LNRYAEVAALDKEPNPARVLGVERPVTHLEPVEPLTPKSKFNGDCWGIEPPVVSRRSMSIYEKYVAVARDGPKPPSSRDAYIYAAYCGEKQLPSFYS
jgi:hypothetical protein